MTDRLPNFLIFQRHLLSPLYSGPGRWIAVEPRTRKQFLLLGKDDCRESFSTLEKIKNKSFFLREEKPQPQILYREFYDRYTYNFPFDDYENEKWKENDLEMMRSYSRSEPPPLKSLKFSGKKHVLPTPNIDRDEGLTKQKLANILHFTFGVHDTIVGNEFGPWYRRTSPSGGGLHPSECFIDLKTQLEGLSPGFYYYDFPSHTLILLKDNIPKHLDTMRQHDQPLSIFCSLALNRVQYRYRTPRSWRAPNIDAGHVLYCFQLACHINELDFQTEVPCVEKLQVGTYSNLPVAFISNFKRVKEERQVKKANEKKIGNKFLTNPTLFIFDFRDTWYAAILAPVEKVISIDIEDINFLTHLQTSRRRDRCCDTTELKIRKFISDPDRIDVLIKGAFLLDEKSAYEIWGQISPAAAKGWYLNFLEMLSNSKKFSGREFPENFIRSAKVRYENALTRKTCRSFNSMCDIKLDILEVLSEISKTLGECSLWDKIDVYSFKITERKSNVFYVSKSKIIDASFSLDRKMIRDIAIGQRWASTGSFGILCCTLINEHQSIQTECIKLGHLAQALILSFSELGLECFVTPAVKDAEFQKIFYGDVDPARIPYLITLGRRL